MISTDLDNIRIDLGVDENQLPDAVGLRYYNDGRDILIDKIIKEKEDFFYNEITTTSVIGQREYSLPKRGDLAQDGTTILDGLVKLKGVSIKWKSDDADLTKLSPRTLENLPKDLLSYDDGVEEFYVVSDNSVFIYPAPTETNTLRFYGIFFPKKLALGDNETLSDQYTKVITSYVGYMYNKSIKDFNVANVFLNEFNIECDRIANAISGRIQAPVDRTLPYLDNYC